MSSCFKNPEKKNLSAKDYIIKKRRKIIFCDLRENFLKYSNQDIFKKQGNNVVCIDNNGIMNKYNNHETGLDMLAAFEDFRKDLRKNVRGQLFKEHFCAPYDISNNNVDCSNNYFANNIQLAYGEGPGYGHLTDYFGALNASIKSKSTEDYRNSYAEIKGVDSDLGGEKLNGGFKNNKFFLLKPTICDNNTRPQLLLSSDITAPQANNVDILID